MLPETKNRQNPRATWHIVFIFYSHLNNNYIESKKNQLRSKLQKLTYDITRTYLHTKVH